MNDPGSFRSAAILATVPSVPPVNVPREYDSVSTRTATIIVHQHNCWLSAARRSEGGHEAGHLVDEGSETNTLQFSLYQICPRGTSYRPRAVCLWTVGSAVQTRNHARSSRFQDYIYYQVLIRQAQMPTGTRVCVLYGTALLLVVAIIGADTVVLRSNDGFSYNVDMLYGHRTHSRVEVRVR